MILKRKGLWLAVALVIALGVVSQLRWGAPRARPDVTASTNVHESVQLDAATPPREVASTNAPAITNIAMKASPAPKQPPTNQLPTNQLTNQPTNQPTSYQPNVPKSRQVLLANRRIAVASGRSFPKKFCAAQTPTSRATAPYVVISEPPVSRDVRIRAMADGARVVGFLPNNALLVEADASALKNLEEDVLFAAAVEYEPTDKIQRALLNEKGGTVEANVVLLNPKDRDAISKFIADNGGKPLRGASSAKSLSAEMPKTLVEKLAGKAEVKWIERHARLKAFNDVAVQPGLMNVTPVWNNYGLTGAGQIITTSDTGIDTGDRTTMHPDIEHNLLGFMRANTWIKKRSYRGDATDTCGHGTHTAGSLVGDGTRSNGSIKGVAYGAKLWAWFCGQGSGGDIMPPLDDWGDWYDFDKTFAPSGVDAHIHSASWGGGNYGCYSDFCKVIDDYAWRNPDFLPVFAAGNAGIGKMTVGEPATAKNILAVGACENLRPTKGSSADNAAQIASFSSCGPCEDGRIKPDIVAPGTYVLSCLSTMASRCSWDDGSYTYYQYMGGTSMATPLTAGTAALVREWLAKYRQRSNPSAALVKAIMLGGATDLFYESGNNVLSSVPDTRQGWGRVDLGASLFPTNGLAVYMNDGLPFAANSNFTFRVTTTNAAPLSVQLVWVDYPAEAEAGKTLVNDLDLSVTAAGQTWLGNGGGEADDVNNVESVRIRDAAATAYVVTVSCPTIPYDHTEGGAAAIYIRGAFDPQHVRCGKPVGTVWMVR